MVLLGNMEPSLLRQSIYRFFFNNKSSVYILWNVNMESSKFWLFFAGYCANLHKEIYLHFLSILACPSVFFDMVTRYTEYFW